MTTLPAELEPQIRKLVARAASKHPRAGAAQEDLVQEALLGAWQALPRVDPSLRNPVAFLMKRARGALIDALRKDGGALGVSGATSFVRRGRGLPEKVARPRSLEAENNDGDRLLDPKDPRGDELLRAVEDRDEVNALTSRLKPKWRAVAVATLGEGMGLADAGHLVGVSESRACQIRTGALAILQEAGRAREDKTEMRAPVAANTDPHYVASLAKQAARIEADLAKLGPAANWDPELPGVGEIVARVAPPKRVLRVWEYWRCADPQETAEAPKPFGGWVYCPGCLDHVKGVEREAAPKTADEERARHDSPCACGHPIGWHRKGVGSCLECICLEAKTPPTSERTTVAPVEHVRSDTSPSGATATATEETEPVAVAAEAPPKAEKLKAAEKKPEPKCDRCGGAPTPIGRSAAPKLVHFDDQEMCGRCMNLILAERKRAAGGKPGPAPKVRPPKPPEPETFACDGCGRKDFKGRRERDGHLRWCGRERPGAKAEKERAASAAAPRLVVPVEESIPSVGTAQASSSDFAALGRQVGELVSTKQAAYGDSFGRSGAVLKILYPLGIAPEQYDDALAVVRVVDKLFRVATDRDALGESPWRDIAGYGLLGAARTAK